MNRALLTSKSPVYGTPPEFYAWLDRQFGFSVDVCALPSNAKHSRFWSPADNGLVQSWEGETAFMNPPYGRSIGQWMAKARDEALFDRAIVVQVLPARVDAEWWRTFVMSRDRRAGALIRSAYNERTGVLWLRWAGLITGVYFHDERLPFEGMGTEGDGAPFPTAVVVHAHPSRRPKSPELEAGELCITEGWPK